VILPNKYINSEYSLFGVGAIILEKLSRPKTMSHLWSEVRENPIVNTYQRFVMCLDFLFIIGALDIVDGKIEKNRRVLR